MSSDITVFVEKRVGGRWAHQPGDRARKWGLPGLETTFGYKSFAILADMRNEWDLKPISPPRGLPLDVSSHVSEAFENECGIMESYFSLRELQNFSWDAPITLKEPERFSCGATEIPGETPPTYRDFSDGLIHNELISPLIKLGPPNDIRIVFWFDQ